jgi:chromosome segregation ATPase
LTLAEADAELQRLNVLKKQHTDEQYLARRKQRELPGEIARLQRRIDTLAQDMATAKAHARDPIVIGVQSYSDKEALDALATRLKSLPTAVSENRSVTLGQYQGLTFGLFLSPYGSPDVFVEGAITRMAPLSRDHHGPRAILNAAERIVDSYDAQCTSTRHDLTIAQTQLRDYEARLGAAFSHDGYATELTELRDRLKAALANPAEHVTEISALAERIKTLKASQSIEAASERHTPRAAATAAEPVTSRILERIKELPTPQPEAQKLVPVTVAEPSPPPVHAAPFQASQPSLFAAPLPRSGKTKPSYQQRVSREERARAAGQLSLF